MEKIEQVKQKLGLEGADFFVVTELEEVACNKPFNYSLPRYFDF